MKKKIIIAILTIFFSINFTNLLADPKLKICMEIAFSFLKQKL